MNLYEQSNYHINIKQHNDIPTIKGMSVCPSTSFQQNTSHTLTLNASSGTPPYNYHWIITKPDGTSDINLPNEPTISYLFNQSTELRNYVISSYITDSCPSESGGPKVSNVETCSVSVIPTPTCIPKPGEINVGGVCVSKNIIVASGIGVGALALTMLLKYYEYKY